MARRFATRIGAIRANRFARFNSQKNPYLGVRQRSGEGVVRRNRCPKGCFWRVRFLSAPLRFSGVLRANLKGAEKKRTLQKHPFGQRFLRTTPSPLLWRALIIFVTCERFARIASNLRFARIASNLQFAILAPRSAIRKEGVRSAREPRSESRA